MAEMGKSRSNVLLTMAEKGFTNIRAIATSQRTASKPTLGQHSAQPVPYTSKRASLATLSVVSAPDASESLPHFATAPIPDGRGTEWTAHSIFSGCGGLDVGFLQEGVRPIAAYDIAKYALENYNENLPGDARLADLAVQSPPFVGAQVLLAGAPCQGFSTVGKRQIEDPRNALLARVADMAVKEMPRVVVMENVPAALSGTHRKHWERAEEQLRNASYNVRRIQLNGEESGVAQRRRRLFLVAWLGSDCIRIEPDPIPPPSLRCVLSGLNGTQGHDIDWPKPESVEQAIARRIGQGQRLSDVRISSRAVPTWSIPEVFGETNSSERAVLNAVAKLRRRARRRSFGDGDPVLPEVIEGEIGRPVTMEIQRLVEAGYLRRISEYVDLRHTYNGRYRRLDWRDLSPTVDTHFGRPSLFLHPDEDRGLTVREAARIQGFPDCYRIVGPRRERFVHIGNAVPPPMAARLANFIREAILKS